jgi:hypothetical protein
MKLLNLFNLPNPYNLTTALDFTQPLVEMSTRKYIWGMESCRRVRLTASPPSVSRLFRRCDVLDVSLSYRPPWPVVRLALLFFFKFYIKFVTLMSLDFIARGFELGDVGQHYVTLRWEYSCNDCSCSPRHSTRRCLRVPFSCREEIWFPVVHGNCQQPVVSKRNLSL